MKITLYIFMKGLAKAIKRGDTHFVGNFHRGSWQAEQYMEITLDVGAVKYKEGEVSAQFEIPEAFKLMQMLPEPSPETFAPVEPKPHVEKI